MLNLIPVALALILSCAPCPSAHAGPLAKKTAPPADESLRFFRQTLADSGDAAYGRGVLDGYTVALALEPGQMREIVEGLNREGRPFEIADPGRKAYPVLLTFGRQSHVGGLYLTTEELLSAATPAQKGLMTATRTGWSVAAGVAGATIGSMVGAASKALYGPLGILYGWVGGAFEGAGAGAALGNGAAQEFFDYRARSFQRNLLQEELAPYPEVIFCLPGLLYDGKPASTLLNVVLGNEMGAQFDRIHLDFPMVYNPQDNFSIGKREVSVRLPDGRLLLSARVSPRLDSGLLDSAFASSASGGQGVDLMATFATLSSAPLVTFPGGKPLYTRIVMPTELVQRMRPAQLEIRLAADALGRGTSLSPEPQTALAFRMEGAPWVILRHRFWEESAQDPTYLSYQPKTTTFRQFLKEQEEGLAFAGIKPPRSPAPRESSRQEHIVVLGGSGSIGLGIADYFSTRLGWKITLVGRRMFEELPPETRSFVGARVIVGARSVAGTRGIDYVTADLRSEGLAALKPYLESATLVVNAAEEYPFTSEQASTVRVSSDRLMRALLEAGFGRADKLFVRIGSPVEIRVEGYGAAAKFPYAQAKRDYQQSLEAAMKEGLNAAVLAPAMVVSEYAARQESHRDGLRGLLLGDGSNQPPLVLDAPMDMTTARKVGEAALALWRLKTRGMALPKKPLYVGWPVMGMGELAQWAAAIRNRLLGDSGSPLGPTSVRPPLSLEQTRAVIEQVVADLEKSGSLERAGPTLLLTALAPHCQLCETSDMKDMEDLGVRPIEKLEIVNALVGLVQELMASRPACPAIFGDGSGKKAR